MIMKLSEVSNTIWNIERELNAVQYSSKYKTVKYQMQTCKVLENGEPDSINKLVKL